MPESAATTHLIKDRFRSYLPVVIDVETGGFEAGKHALLEVAAVIIKMDEYGKLQPGTTVHQHIIPYEGLELDKAALEFTGIDPHNPLRQAVSEQLALTEVFKAIRAEIKASQCKRAIMVAHNAAFDQAFIKASVERNKLKRDPFHPFSNLDTVSLAALAYGQTVLARACQSAEIDFNPKEAHSALYDAQKTAELFCTIINKWQTLGGWPLAL